MRSRLSSSIKRGRRRAYIVYITAMKKRNECGCEVATPCDSEGRGHGILRHPTKVCDARSTSPDGKQTIGLNSWRPKGSGYIHKSSRNSHKHEECQPSWMVDTHNIRVRVFDNQDKLLFDHQSGQEMLTTQTLQLCTNLVRHLNTLALTSELEMQVAMGTLENAIIAQLSTIPLEYSQFPSWTALEPGDSSQVYEIVYAIADIRQGPNRKFTGNLVDDLVGTTFQLQ